MLRNFHAKRAIIEIAMKKILNKCISGRLNNKYFPLNESKQLTEPRVMILTKDTVACSMPFLMYTFFIFLTLNLLGDNNESCFESMK